ncbi:MAG: hypothetical protein LLG20_26960 [Acidobacteriales bacterium]|nr:hypothetical protein [Terriglobales bacterium]
MKMRIVLGLSALLALFVVTALAADVSGKWVGTSQGRDGKTRETTFNFKVDGEKLTGTVSGRGGDREISEGKVTGDEISFAVKVSFGDREFKMLYKGKVAGNEIQFTVQREGGERTTQMTAKRAS